MKRNLLIAVLIIIALVVVLWAAHTAGGLIGFLKHLHGR